MIKRRSALKRLSLDHLKLALPWLRGLSQRQLKLDGPRTEQEKFETIRDIKKFYCKHQNIFKSYQNFESLKGVAQKLSRHANLYFERKMVVTHSILELKKFVKYLQS